MVDPLVVLNVVLVMLGDSEMWERRLEDKICFGGDNDGGNDSGNDGDGEMDAVAWDKGYYSKKVPANTIAIDTNNNIMLESNAIGMF